MVEKQKTIIKLELDSVHNLFYSFSIRLCFWIRTTLDKTNREIVLRKSSRRTPPALLVDLDHNLANVLLLPLVHVRILCLLEAERLLVHNRLNPVGLDRGTHL